MMIKNAAVVGAGLMGAGIARHMSNHGVTVTLVDNSEEQLARASRGNHNQTLKYTSDMTALE